MKVLVIGAGGREHAIAWKLAQSPRITEVLVAPGNPGTAREPKLRNLAPSAVADLVELAQREQVGFTVVGPEAPLAAGVVDAFRAAQLPIFGPTRAAARSACPCATCLRSRSCIRPGAAAWHGSHCPRETPCGYSQSR